MTPDRSGLRSGLLVKFNAVNVTKLPFGNVPRPSLEPRHRAARLAVVLGQSPIAMGESLEARHLLAHDLFFGDDDSVLSPVTVTEAEFSSGSSVDRHSCLNEGNGETLEAPSEPVVEGALGVIFGDQESLEESLDITEMGVDRDTPDEGQVDHLLADVTDESLVASVDDETLEGAIAATMDSLSVASEEDDDEKDASRSRTIWSQFASATTAAADDEWTSSEGADEQDAALVIEARYLTRGPPSESAQTASTNEFSTTSSPSLTSPKLDLSSLVGEAARQWISADLVADASRRLADIEFLVADLPGQALGRTIGNTIFLDATAAGHGWHLGLHDRELASSARFDLLTVLVHEMGHVLGFEHVADATSVMSDRLSVGERKLLDDATISTLRSAARTLEGVDDYLLTSEPDFDSQGPVTTDTGGTTNGGPPIIFGENTVSIGPERPHGGQVEGMPGTPVGGAVTGVAISPADPKVVYVGTPNGGVWKTDNIDEVRQVAITDLDDPLRAKGPDLGEWKTVAAVSGVGPLSEGTYRYKVSFFNGSTNTESNASGEISVVVPTGQNVGVELTNLPLGPEGTTERRLYRLGPGATSYQRVPNPSAPAIRLDNNRETTFLDTAAANTLIAAPTTAQPFPKWKALTDNWDSLSISYLAFDPTDATGQTLYAGTGNVSNSRVGGQSIGILKTTDGGQTWTVVGGTDRELRDLRVTSITVASPRLLPKPSESSTTSTAGVTKQVQSVAGGLLDPGVYKYRIAFANRATGEEFPASSEFSVTLLPGQNQITLGSLPVDSSQGATATNRARLIYRTMADGETFYLAQIIDHNRPNETWVDVVPNASPVLLVGTRYDAADPAQRGGLYRSVDGGDTWQRISDQDATVPVSGLPPGNVTDLKMAYQPGAPTGLPVLYAAHAGVISGFNATGQHVDPFTGAGIYRSVDGGLTWEKVSGNVPDAVAATFNFETIFPERIMLAVQSIRLQIPDVTATTATDGGTGGTNGGQQGPGTYRYRFTFVDAGGNESSASSEVTIRDLADKHHVVLNNLPVRTQGTQLRIYRQGPAAANAEFKLLATIAKHDETTYLDRLGVALDLTQPADVNRAASPGAALASDDGAGGKLVVGVYKYRFTFVAWNGKETNASGDVSINLTQANRKIKLTRIALGPGDTRARLIYRKDPTAADYKLVASLNDNTTTEYTDLYALPIDPSVAAPATAADAPAVAVAKATNGASTLAAGLYRYRFAVGSSRASDPIAVTLTGSSRITLSNFPAGAKIYRADGASDFFQLIATLPNNGTTFVDRYPLPKNVTQLLAGGAGGPNVAGTPAPAATPPVPPTTATVGAGAAGVVANYIYRLTELTDVGAESNASAEIVATGASPGSTVTISPLPTRAANSILRVYRAPQGTAAFVLVATVNEVATTSVSDTILPVLAPAPDVVAARTMAIDNSFGGQIMKGLYKYQLSFYDEGGVESQRSASWEVNVLDDRREVKISNLPSGARRILYRTGPNDDNFVMIATLEAGEQKYTDLLGTAIDVTTNDAQRPAALAVGTAGTNATQQAGGQLLNIEYKYIITGLFADGKESNPSNPALTHTVGAIGSRITISPLPTESGFVARRIYRSDANTPYRLVGTVNNATSASFIDVLIPGNAAGGGPLTDAPTVASAQDAGPGGQLQGGNYEYKVTFLAADGSESKPSESLFVFAQTANNFIRLTGIPTGGAARRIYRKDPGGAAAFRLIGSINDATSTSYIDTLGPLFNVAGPVDADRQTAPAFAVATDDGRGGQLPAGEYEYRLTFLNALGAESNASAPLKIKLDLLNHQVRLTQLQLGPDGTSARRLYRKTPGSANFVLVATILDNTTKEWLDTVRDPRDISVSLTGLANAPEVITRATAGTAGAANTGLMAAGSYTYRFTLLDNRGRESDQSLDVVVNAVVDQGSVTLSNLPTRTAGNTLVIYRRGPAAGSPFERIATIQDSNAATYTDTLGTTIDSATAAPVVTATTLIDRGTGGNLQAGTYRYRITFLTAAGETAPSAELTIRTVPAQHKIELTGIPQGHIRRIYRTAANGSSFQLIATLPNDATATYEDKMGGFRDVNYPVADMSHLFAAVVGRTNTNDDYGGDSELKRVFASDNLGDSWRFVVDTPARKTIQPLRVCWNSIRCTRVSKETSTSPSQSIPTFRISFT